MEIGDRVSWQPRGKGTHIKTGRVVDILKMQKNVVYKIVSDGKFFYADMNILKKRRK